MNEYAPWLIAAMLLLSLSLIIGLLRALRGPTLQDRLPAVQLLGTGGVALLMLLSVLQVIPALLDVALVLALLTAVAAAALSRREISHD